MITKQEAGKVVKKFEMEPRAAIKCSLRRPHFIAHLKSIGKIPEDDKD